MNTVEGNKIEAGNRLIAEFMGFQISEWIERDGSFLGYYLLDAEGNSDFSDGIDWYNPENNWNLLMAVVEKIEGLNIHFNIDQNTCEVYSGITLPTTIYNTAETKMQCVWETVIQFIEWYNKNQTK